MRFSSCLLGVLVIQLGMLGQSEPQLIGSLPSIIGEASGLICTGSDTCWTHNDTDDDARIYRINGNGQFQAQATFDAAMQVDYESMASSTEGTWFLGDFGNNENERQDLVIYAFEAPASSSSLLTTRSIRFDLSDQVDFPPNSANLNFDIEAMVWSQGELVLFSRNRSTPFNGITKVYRLNDQDSIQTAQLFASFFTSLDESSGVIKGADLSPSQDRLALVSDRGLYLWDSFDLTTTDFNTYSTYSWDLSRSFEGIAFIDECQLRLITDGNGVSEFYALDICTSRVLDKGIDQMVEQFASNAWRLKNGQTGDWTCFDQQGRMVETRHQAREFHVGVLPHGVYIMRVITSDGNMLSYRILR